MTKKIYTAGKHILQIFICIIIIMSFFSKTVSAQDNNSSQHEIDSILSIIKPNTPDSLKAKYYCEIAKTTDNTDTALKYNKLSLSYCNEDDYELLAANNYNIGYSYCMSGQPQEALPYGLKAVEFYQKAHNETRKGLAYIITAVCYNSLKVNDSTFYYFDNALKTFLEIKDTSMISYTYQQMGNVYSELGFKDAALENFEKALHYVTLSGDTLGAASCYSCMGEIYWRKSDTLYNLSIDYLKKAVEIYDLQTAETYYQVRKFNTYAELSNIYITLAKKTDEKKYADSCLMFCQESSNYFFSQGMYPNYLDTRKTYVEYLVFYKKYNEALSEITNWEKYLESGTSKESYHKMLYEVYSKIGDYKNALKNLEIYNELKLSRINDNTLNALKDAEVARTKMLEGLEREKDEKIHNEEKRRLKTLIISLIGGLFLVSLLVFYIFRVLNIKRKANKELSQKNDMLFQQKNEIEVQRDKIEKQRNEIISSVNYAERIQRAAIPSENEINNLFPENFVFYRPRNIVSGDYYYITQCGKYKVFIVADCTGHGVPGAFLSMLGLSGLKEYMVTENDAANPGTVLDKMRNFIKTTLAAQKNGVDIRDGMDMTVCCYDFENMELRYAIANQKIYIIRNGELIKLKGDSMPIGRYIKEKEHFQSLSIKIKPGDMVYTFSDGIQDQTGTDLGGNKRKFTSMQLQETLMNVADKPASEQMKIIETTVTNWRGDFPQIDDMTLVGIRVQN